MSNFACPVIEVAVALAKNVLAPLAITASASAIDSAIQRNMKESLEQEKESF